LTIVVKVLSQVVTSITAWHCGPL